jgi:predicted metal-dependent hydrolase
METTAERLGLTASVLERGRTEFALGHFFEAHEAWLQAWRASFGDERRLLQGLIQAAGAYHKMSRGRQPIGMSILLERALEQLEPLPDGYAGLDLDGFRRGLRRSRQEALGWQSGGPAPSGPARLGPARAVRATQNTAPFAAKAEVPRTTL